MQIRWSSLALRKKSAMADGDAGFGGQKMRTRRQLEGHAMHQGDLISFHFMAQFAQSIVCCVRICTMLSALRERVSLCGGRDLHWLARASPARPRQSISKHEEPHHRPISQLTEL